MALEMNVIIVSIAASVFGLLSAILGFAAQATKSRASDYTVSLYGCVHSASPASRLAYGAAFSILITQIIISIFIGSSFCNRRGQQFSVPAQGGNKRNIAIILFIISWVTFSTCFKYFITGAQIEARGTNDNVDYYCQRVTRQFVVGASMALTTFNLSVGAYILLNSSNDIQVGGIAMVPPSQPPKTAVAQQFPPGVPGVPEPQKPNQNYYPPPATVPAGYGYNTQSYA